MACREILKILMVIFNCTIFLAGTSTVVIGVLFQIGKESVFKVLRNSSTDLLQLEVDRLAKAGYLLIGIGAILAVLGFLGCCGAFCDNKYMLLAFFIIIVVMFIMEVVAAVLVLVYQSKVKETLENKAGEALTQSIKESYSQNNTITKLWNETMDMLKCCGYNNYTDFKKSRAVSVTNIINQGKDTSRYPSPCCPDKGDVCDGGKAKQEKVIGCREALINWLKSKAALIGSVAFCISALEVAAMIVSLLLYKD